MLFYAEGVADQSPKLQSAPGVDEKPELVFTPKALYNLVYRLQRKEGEEKSFPDPECASRLWALLYNAFGVKTK